MAPSSPHWGPHSPARTGPRAGADALRLGGRPRLLGHRGTASARTERVPQDEVW
jgi:hypothetical protein